MKKTKKTMAIAATLLIGSLTTGCHNDPAKDTVSTQSDYDASYINSVDDSNNNIDQDITTEYNPENEIPQDVYGPPNVDN